MVECRIEVFSISVSPLQRRSNSDINGLGPVPYFEFELRSYSPFIILLSNTINRVH